MDSISIAPAESREREKPYAWKNVKTELLGGMYEIGYTLGKKWWNQGYATEAAAAVRDYWFGMVGAPWLAGFHASQNVASSRCPRCTGRTNGTSGECRDNRLTFTPLPHTFADLAEYGQKGPLWTK